MISEIKFLSKRKLKQVFGQACRTIQKINYEHSFWDYNGHDIQGTFTIYVDQFSEFLDPSLPIGRPCIYYNSCNKVDIWLTLPFLSAVHVDSEWPQF